MHFSKQKNPIVVEYSEQHFTTSTISKNTVQGHLAYYMIVQLALLRCLCAPKQKQQSLKSSFTSSSQPQQPHTAVCPHKADSSVDLMEIELYKISSLVPVLILLKCCHQISYLVWYVLEIHGFFKAGKQYNTTRFVYLLIGILGIQLLR